jgi:hypothetical protein
MIYNPGGQLGKSVQGGGQRPRKAAGLVNSNQNRARTSHNADEISEHRKLERTFSAVNVREIDEFPLRLG